MAKIGSIKPKYLATNDGVVTLPDGTLIRSQEMKDYKLSLLEDNSLINIFENEGQYLTMLVRERIQREKLMPEEGEEDYED